MKEQTIKETYSICNTYVSCSFVSGFDYRFTDNFTTKLLFWIMNIDRFDWKGLFDCFLVSCLFFEKRMESVTLLFEKITEPGTTVDTNERTNIWKFEKITEPVNNSGHKRTYKYLKKNHARFCKLLVLSKWYCYNIVIVTWKNMKCVLRFCHLFLLHFVLFLVCFISVNNKIRTIIAMKEQIELEMHIKS